MKKPLIELYTRNIKKELAIPDYVAKIYLRLFGVPLGKRFRENAAKSCLRNIDLHDKTILDAGCGIGDFSFYLSDMGADVIGIDINEDKIAIANDIAKSYSINASFFCKDLMELDTLPYPSYDGIICLAVLEHIKNDKELLTGFYDILNDSGFMILSTTTDSRKIVKEKEIEDGHVRIGYNEKQLKRMLIDVGFTIEEVIYGDSLNLYYYLNRFSSIIPGQRSKKILSPILFPFFAVLMSISDGLMGKKGSEFTFKCIK